MFVFRPDLNIGATIKALQQRNVLQILAEPNLITVEGKDASFLAGGSFPFPTMTTTSTGGAVAPVITVQFKPFGVKLDFTPTVTANGAIHLIVAPEVSALDFANAVTLQGFLIPAITQRRAETEVILKDGESFAIAGLIDNRVVNAVYKIPGLGNIPILGQIFSSRSTQEDQLANCWWSSRRISSSRVRGREGDAPGIPGNIPAHRLGSEGEEEGQPLRPFCNRSHVGPRGHQEPQERINRARLPAPYRCSSSVILVPVIFGFMGFAVDLGRLYLVRAELNQAANAMAVAAASRLIGTIAATDYANTAADAPLDDSLADANKYNFGSRVVGTSHRAARQPGAGARLLRLPSPMPSPRRPIGAASTADGTTARHVTINLTAEAPARLLVAAGAGPNAARRRSRRQAVAGVSAPLCTACGIEPLRLPQLSRLTPRISELWLHRRQVLHPRLQLHSAPAPAVLPGTTGPLRAVPRDRPLRRPARPSPKTSSCSGPARRVCLPSPVTPGWSCSIIGNTETHLGHRTSRRLRGCRAPQQQVLQAMCGLSSRFTTAPPSPPAPLPSPT